ncbi:MAG: DUF3488 and transglutaminase-like domain-containing protein [Actinomycetota bacterium]|nr:DUF3488 and transglutaminase-like domain-containing protein [Actinomycetota bacterium]
MTLAIVAGTLMAIIAAAYRWPPEWTLLAGLLLTGSVLAYAVYRSTLDFGVPTARTLRRSTEGIASGWVRMLTVELPADARPDLLATPVALSAIAAFAGVLIAIRTRAVLAPIAPAFVLLLTGLLYSADQNQSHLLPTATLLAVAAVLTVIRAGSAGARATHHDETLLLTPGGRSSFLPIGALISAAPAIAAVLLLAVASAYAVPSVDHGARFDPRSLKTTHLQVASTLSPLVAVRSQLLQRPVRPVLEVRLLGSSEQGTIDRVRIAALGEFDGANWSSLDNFIVVGHKLAPDPRISQSLTISARITIDDLPTPFLPEFGRPTEITSLSGTVGQVGFSSTSGNLATSASSLHGIAYDIAADLRPRTDALERATPGDAAQFSGDNSARASTPPEIMTLAHRLTDNLSNPYDKLEAIERYLRTFPYDLHGAPGEGYSTISRILTGSADSDHNGYAEQHAAAFAVLAESLGFASRIAVGYVLRNGHHNAFTVTTSDAHAWPEVYFMGYGWVPFEPTDPSRSAKSKTSPLKDTTVENTTTIVPPVTTGTALAPIPSAHGAPGNGLVSVLVGTAISAAVLVSVLVVLELATALSKGRRRRRRRRHADLAERVFGAWQEVQDRLVECRITIPAALSANELAEHAAKTLPSDAGPPLRSLARIATEAFFGEEMTEQSIARSWALERELRRMLKPGRWPIASRLYFWLDPRPILARWRISIYRRRVLKPMQSR